MTEATAIVRIMCTFDIQVSAAQVTANAISNGLAAAGEVAREAAVAAVKTQESPKGMALAQGTAPVGHVRRVTASLECE